MAAPGGGGVVGFPGPQFPRPPQQVPFMPGPPAPYGAGAGGMMPPALAPRAPYGVGPLPQMAPPGPGPRQPLPPPPARTAVPATATAPDPRAFLSDAVLGRVLSDTGAALEAAYELLRVPPSARTAEQVARLGALQRELHLRQTELVGPVAGSLAVPGGGRPVPLRKEALRALLKYDDLPPYLQATVFRQEYLAAAAAEATAAAERRAAKAAAAAEKRRAYKAKRRAEAAALKAAAAAAGGGGGGAGTAAAAAGATAGEAAGDDDDDDDDEEGDDDGGGDDELDGRDDA
jgi:hypothetical protein